MKNSSIFLTTVIKVHYETDEFLFLQGTNFLTGVSLQVPQFYDLVF